MRRGGKISAPEFTTPKNRFSVAAWCAPQNNSNVQSANAFPAARTPHHTSVIVTSASASPWAVARIADGAPPDLRVAAPNDCTPGPTTHPSMHNVMNAIHASEPEKHGRTAPVVESTPPRLADPLHLLARPLGTTSAAGCHFPYAETASADALSAQTVAAKGELMAQPVAPSAHEVRHARVLHRPMRDDGAVDVDFTGNSAGAERLLRSGIMPKQGVASWSRERARSAPSVILG